MTDGRVAGNALGQLHAFGWPAAFEQFLRALVREVQANLQIDHRLADDAEAEVARLDDARMNRADGNLVYAFAADRLERKGRAVILEFHRGGDGVLAQREVIFRPERVSHQRSRIGMANGFDAEQIFNLALEARSRIIERRQSSDRRIVRGQIFGRVQQTSSRGLARRDNEFQKRPCPRDDHWRPSGPVRR